MAIPTCFLEKTINFPCIVLILGISSYDMGLLIFLSANVPVLMFAICKYRVKREKML